LNNTAAKLDLSKMIRLVVYVFAFLKATSCPTGFFQRTTNMYMRVL